MGITFSNTSPQNPPEKLSNHFDNIQSLLTKTQKSSYYIHKEINTLKEQQYDNTLLYSVFPNNSKEVIISGIFGPYNNYYYYVKFIHKPNKISSIEYKHFNLQDNIDHTCNQEIELDKEEDECIELSENMFEILEKEEEQIDNSVEEEPVDSNNKEETDDIDYNKEVITSTSGDLEEIDEYDEREIYKISKNMMRKRRKYNRNKGKPNKVNKGKGSKCKRKK